MISESSSRAAFLGKNDELEEEAYAEDGARVATPTTVFKLYKWRFVIAALYASGNAMNAFEWICFAPVIDVTKSRFDIDSQTGNMLSLIYLFLFLPGSILNMYVTERWGLRVNLIVGAALNLGCAWLRYAGMFIGSPHASFAVVLLGQCLGAIGQPFFTNTPTRIAGTWFGVHERDAATIVISLFNAIGNALGSLVPSLIVNTTDDLPWLMLYQAAFATVIGGLSFVFARDEPPTPPNAAAAGRVLELKRQMATPTALQQSAEEEGGDGEQTTSAAAAAWAHLVAEAGMLLRNRNFCLLAVAFGIGLGLFNALLTVLSQLLTPCGYDDTTAGLSGGALLGTGLIVSGFVGVLLERTHAYAPIFRCGVLAVLGGLFFMLSSLQPSSEAQVIASFAALGAALIPLLPVSLETAAECTYPISEDTSAGVLMLIGQITGIAYIFVLTYLIGLPPSDSCGSVVTPAAGFIIANMAVGVVCGLLFRKDYRRPKEE